MAGVRRVFLAALAARVAVADLAPFKFETFPLGAVKASGWLQDQLRLSGDAAGGHLYDFYRYVGQSTWVGGDQEYSPLRESATYWFNYAVPLAFTLGDDRIKAQAKEFLDYVIDHQFEDGWLGPEEKIEERGIWARAYLLFGMTQYAEADPSETDRIVDAMHRFMKLTNTMLKDNFKGLIPDRDAGETYDDGLFGVSRAFEYPIPLQWLYENYPRENGDMILETFELMFEGSRAGGQDWNEFFTEENFPQVGTPDFQTSGFSHGVNTAEGLRYSTVEYRLTKDESLIQKAYDAVDLTLKYQTSFSGSISADEHLGGHGPNRGSELCMTVENMFSHSWLYRFHGANYFADATERAAFNALPAGVTSDWWAHSYVTQTNQPWARMLEGDNPFFNVNNYGVVYGLEPNYPCCTVNHPQGLPKFISTAYARNGEDGIIHMLLSPTYVDTKIGDSSVKVNCDTNYPFSDELSYTIESETDFKFSVRVPEWTVLEDATITVGDGEAQPLSRNDNGLHDVSVGSGTTSITVKLPMKITTATRDDSIAFYHGPLLYAAHIAHNETVTTPRSGSGEEALPEDQYDARAYDVSYSPVEDWQYAVDPSTVVVKHDRDQNAELPNPVWVSDGPPTSLEVDAYLIDWPVANGTAAPPPVNPVVDKSQKVTLKLIPYGAAKLHIAQFPVAKFEA